MRNSMKMAPALALGALVLCCVTASVAQAAAIYACVKPKSGATRIVAAKAKCRRGEQKLSWNTAGPRGPAGANGRSGANGAAGGEGKAGTNGVADVYSTSQPLTEPKALPAGGTIVLTKVLPPGSYSVTAKTTITAEASKAATIEMFCDLGDAAGTSGGGEGSLLDLTGWEGPLGEKGPTNFVAESPLMLASAMTSTVTSTLEVQCVNISGQQMKSAAAQMQALTVASVR